MNGFAYGGALADPSPVKGPDEFANFVMTASGLVHLNEHDGTLGSGPAPATTAAFAFYYDTIVEGDRPQPTVPREPDQPEVPPFDPFDHLEDPIPDDRTLSDWLDDLEMQFSYFSGFEIGYEGFPQYGPNGESIFRTASVVLGTIISEDGSIVFGSPPPIVEPAPFSPEVGSHGPDLFNVGPWEGSGEEYEIREEEEDEDQESEGEAEGE